MGTLAIPITADGDFNITEKNSNQSRITVYFRGGFGGGTITLGWRDSDGAVQPYTTDASFTAAGEAVVESGLGRIVVASMAGSTTPTVFVEMSPNPTGRG